LLPWHTATDRTEVAQSKANKRGADDEKDFSTVTYKEKKLKSRPVKL